jgi:hypothetical protein
MYNSGHPNRWGPRKTHRGKADGCGVQFLRRVTQKDITDTKGFKHAHHRGLFDHVPQVQGRSDCSAGQVMAGNPQYKKYRTPDRRVWFEIYPGKLVEARSQKDAQRHKDQGANGVSKDYIRNFYGPLQSL